MTSGFKTGLCRGNQASLPALNGAGRYKRKTHGSRYGYWTNYVYRGLFGMDAATMKETWANPVRGDARIARNYVPESVGLEAIAYCEKMVGLLDLDDIQQAHDLAIQATQAKFAKHFPMG